MRRLIYIYILIIMFLIMPLPNTYCVVEEIKDYYQTGTCSCQTNGYYAQGVLVIHSPSMGTTLGYIMYRPSIQKVEEITITTNIILDLFNSNDVKPVAVWISNNQLSYTSGNYNLMVHTLGFYGIGVAVASNASGGYTEYVIGLGLRSGVNTIMTVLTRGTLSYRKSLTLTIHLSKLTDESMYLEVYIDDIKVYVSDKIYKTVPIFNPRYIYIVSGGSGNAYTAAAFTHIVFNSESSRYLGIQPIEMAILILTPSVGVYIHNSTHLVLSYVCFYRNNISECETYRVVIYDNKTGETISDIDIEISESPIPNLAIYRSYIYVKGIDVVMVELYDINGSLIGKGMLKMPNIHIEQSPYVSFIFTMLPISIIVALVVKTQGMINIGLGLIASGIIILLLPWIGVSFSGIYALSLLLIMFGIIVLVMYRS
ncbi:MAG: hypothetical protein QW611_03930 [Ignisphaera sp.]